MTYHPHDATITCNDIKAVSTGEVVYKIAQELNWPLSIEAKNMIAVSILSDSLGLIQNLLPLKAFILSLNL